MKPDAVTLELAIARLEELGDPDLAARLRPVQRRVARNEPQVVEQFSMLAKSPTIPDGWSWDDVNGGSEDPNFTGNYWGVRLKPGEPTLWQAGHVLFIRLWDTYDQDRDRSYWLRVSRVPGQTVLIVDGYRGARRGYQVFDGGHEAPLVSADALGIVAYIQGWLDRARANPLPDWDKALEGF